MIILAGDIGGTKTAVAIALGWLFGVRPAGR